MWATLTAVVSAATMTSKTSLVPPRLWLAILRHPRGGLHLIAAGWRLRRRQWWRHWPPLPLPGEAYFEFRRATAVADGELSADDLLAAATWSSRALRNR